MDNLLKGMKETLSDVHILFVDDEMGVLNAVQDSLAMVYGIAVDTSQSALSALEMFRQHPYDCLILDYEMPEIDGITLLKKVRTINRDIPVIILTGKSREDVVIDAVNTGVDYYLQKGSSPESFFPELAHDIEKAVRRYRAEKALQLSEQKYRVVVESQTEFICKMDKHGLIRFVNPAFAAYLSRTEESMIGLSFFSFYPLDNAFGVLLSSNGDDQTITRELPLSSPDGMVRWHRWNIRKILNLDPESVEVLAVGYDITERIEMEHQITVQRDLGLALALCSSVEAVLQKCMETASLLSGMESGVVFLKDTTSGLFQISYEYGPMCVDLKKCSRAWEQEQIWMGTVLSGNTLYFDLKDLRRADCPFVSAMVIPIQRYDDVMGWFVLGSDLLPSVPQLCRKTLEMLPSQVGNVIGRIEAEEALRDALLESEQRYMQLSESSLDAIAILSGLQVVHLNPAAIRLFEIASPDDLHEHPVHTYEHPDSVDEVEAMIRSCLTKNSQVSCETLLISREGKKIYAELIAVPISQNGEPGVLLIIRDMTRQKLQAQAIAESEQRFREMTDLLPEPVFETGKDGVLTFCNRSAVEMFGFGSHDLSAGFPLKDLISPDDRSRLFDMGASIRSDRKARSGEYRIHYPPGVSRPVLLSLAAIERNGVFSGMRGVIFDITDIKQYENQLKLIIEEKDVLFREVHHRVKNNMQIISSLLQLQEEYVTDENILAVLQDCQQRITSMALVHETLYRTESISGLPFGEYLSQLSNEIREGFATVRDVSIEINVGDIYLSLDTAVTLGLIINELMVNSMKYAFTGRATGTIQIGMTHGDGEYLLEYTDDGCGLPTDFDIDRSTTLGMRLVRLLARQMSGAVQIPKETGRGMIFRISFSEKRV